jgi:enoyl-CoA hydratase/carnithine racemase
VLRSYQDGVLVLTLNRPDRHNAWTPELETEYFDALEQADQDSSVRAIVVTGAGRSFCPGMDAERLSRSAAGEPYLVDRRSQSLATGLRTPVIAAVNGACAGVGLVHALYCDFRFCVPEAKLTTAFAVRGLPAEDGISWVLSRLLGPSRAFDLLATSRVITGEEAHRLGLVDRLVQPGELLTQAVDYARGLAQRVSPVSLAMIKAQVWADPGETLEQARVRSRHYLAVARLQPDFAEGAAALAERREPRFPGLSSLYL